MHVGWKPGEAHWTHEQEDEVRMMAATVQEPMWDADDVAAFLKLSRSWVYARAAAGELPGRKIGGLWRFDPETIRRYARGELPPAGGGARVVKLGRD